MTNNNLTVEKPNNVREDEEGLVYVFSQKQEREIWKKKEVEFQKKKGLWGNSWRKKGEGMNIFIGIGFEILMWIGICNNFL